MLVQIRDNPYYHRRPIEEERHFYGRTREIEQAVRSIQHRELVSLVGPRRIGKTSLLFRLRALNGDKLHGVERGYVYIYVDGQAHRTTRTSDFYSEVLDTAKTILDQGGRALRPHEEPQEGMAFGAFRRAMLSLLKRKITPVVLLDEFDVLSENPSFDSAFFDGMRSIATQGAVFVTASKRTLFQLYHNKEAMGSPFFNYFRTLYLGLFDEASARRLIEEPSAAHGVHFEERTVQDILELAGRHPFFLQRVCHFAFDLRGRRRGELEEADRQSLREQSGQDLVDHMARYWESLKQEEQRVLRGVARDGVVSTGPAGTLDDLVLQCLLIRTNGGYQVFSALFNDYLRTLPLSAPAPHQEWLDRFEIGEKLGQGPMSVVHKAYQPDLDRYVAIKRLVSQPESLIKDSALFRHEAQAIARLDHPNILRVYDFYQRDDQVFIVMQYAAGGSLEDRLRDAEEPLDPVRAVEIVICIGGALEYAHRQGIVHRDVKPGNIFLGENDQPLLGDFGLALTSGENPLDEEALSGAVDYASPEQVRDARDADQRSDIYSLGMVLYHLLVGQVPYAQLTSATRLIKRLESGVPTPRAMNSAISEEMERIILKATAPEPGERYQTTDAIISDLENVLHRGFITCEEERPVRERYVDFELQIGPDGHVTAVSDGGRATANIPIDVPNAVELAVNLIEHGQTNKDLLKSVGKELYALLFPGEVHTYFRQVEAVASREGAKVRLRLNIEADSLARLPLELAYRSQGSYFLANNPDTVLSRYLNLPWPEERVRRRSGPLHLLMIIANPADQFPLDPDEWEAILLQALAAPIGTGQIVPHVVKHATRKEIRNALLEQKPDIIQFVGYGFHQAGKGYLALLDDAGETWEVDDESFANMLMGYDDHLGLVCLATCESAMSDSPQGFLGIAPRIVEKGTPAVVAMRYKVLVETAKIFLEELYLAIAHRKPVDWAVQNARNAIATEKGLGNREFATPVLYMRARDGEIF
jgi:serine/threonine protein kinase/AAA+ ATPase superfamily predicted ATPase